MDPLTFRFRFVVAMLFAAVITAAILRHVIHIYGGLSRENIRLDALLGVVFVIGIGIIWRWTRRRR